MRAPFPLYKDELFITTGIMTLNNFHAMEIDLNSEVHPWKGKALANKWTYQDFRMLDSGDDLFKIATRYHILTQEKQPKMNKYELE